MTSVLLLLAYLTAQIPPMPPGHNFAAMRHFAEMARGGRQVTAAYDAARTHQFNARYYRNADSLTADEANNPHTRKTLRERARYECVESNSFLKGMVHTKANDTIGTGPRLQLIKSDRTGRGGTNDGVASKIEDSFADWANEIRLAQKLRTGVLSRIVSGEMFLQFITNPRLQHPVKLDIAVVEPDLITDPMGQMTLDPYTVDGIKFDTRWNPVAYVRVQDQGWRFPMLAVKPDEIPADQMIHVFKTDRPGQHRAVPEVTPALPLCALLRDYTLSVVHSAKTAAKHSAVIQSRAPRTTPDGETQGHDPSVKPFDAVDIDYDMIVSLPYGWEMNQFKAEQPTTTYEMFRNAILNEIARCIHMPFNKAAGNSLGYNYSSGQLDHKDYYGAIAVDRADLEIDALDRILDAWMLEGSLVGVPGVSRVSRSMPHYWFWDSPGHADPTKDATARKIRLETTSTWADECAAEGSDWQRQMRQRGTELATAIAIEKEMKLPPGSLSKIPQPPVAKAGQPDKANDAEDPDQEDDVEEQDAEKQESA